MWVVRIKGFVIWEPTSWASPLVYGELTNFGNKITNTYKIQTITYILFGTIRPICGGAAAQTCAALFYGELTNFGNELTNTYKLRI